MKMLPAGAELFHADGQTDTNDEVNSRFFVILRKRLIYSNCIPVQWTMISLYNTDAMCLLRSTIWVFK
jgi:hypothetical protein